MLKGFSVPKSSFGQAALTPPSARQELAMPKTTLDQAYHFWNVHYEGSSSRSSDATRRPRKGQPAASRVMKGTMT
jgi:hypothetical protein